MSTVPKVCVYPYLPRLMALHGSYGMAVASARPGLLGAYFATCRAHWRLLQHAPLKARVAGREARLQRFTQIIEHDGAAGLKNLTDTWQACLWEELGAFLAAAAPATAGEYLKELVGLLGRTHDRAVYNLLACDYGRWGGKLKKLSLDQPLGRGEDEEGGATLLDLLADPHAARPESGLRALVRRTVREWAARKSERRPGRAGIYQAIGRAWWLHVDGGVSVSELVRRHGPALGSEDQLRDLLKEITREVRAAVGQADYRQPMVELAPPSDLPCLLLEYGDMELAA